LRTANIVLQSTIERIYAPFPEQAKRTDVEEEHGAAATNAATAPRGLYADVDRGLFLIRGENVLLIGEIDLDKDDDPPPGYERGELGEVKRIAAERKAEEQAEEKIRLKGLAKFGFEGENLGEFIL
jgi:U6 snRNA-associated Sm-like protein LSm1